MGRNRKNKILRAYLNGISVGDLKKDTNGAISFKYSLEWLNDGFAISRSLPLQEGEYKGEIVSRYFDNLLPDNDEIRKKIATKFGAESIRPFDMLEVIGRDCVGALSFVVGSGEPRVPFELDYTALSDSDIAMRIKGLGSSGPLGMEDGDFRISIAGAQEKTALLKIDGKWHEPHGMTPTTHILKTSIGALGVDINFEDSIDNEWASLLVMKKFGLATCNATIEQFEDQRVLVVERFDRDWRQYKKKNVLVRLPQEDLCQSLGVSPYQKYQSEGGPGIEQIAKFLRSSKVENDHLNFFKSILVFDLLYATDGHAKNFSVFVEPDGVRLTPLYDVMGGYFLYKREKLPIQKLKLAMKVGYSGHYQFKRIGPRHYQETAKLCGISKTTFESILVDVQEAYQNLSFNKKELDSHLNQATLDILLEGMKKRAAVLF